MEGGLDVLPERIEGRAGLLLRRWTTDDVEALDSAIAESLDHLRPWMGWAVQEPLSIPSRRALIDEWGRQWAQGGDVFLGVFLDGRIAGSCGLHRRIAPDGVEIGYWISPRFVRRGLATEAVRALTDAALARPDIGHVEIHHDKANVASSGIPRKLGFVFLGEHPDEPEAPHDLGIEWRWRMDQERWRTVPPSSS